MLNRCFALASIRWGNVWTKRTIPNVRFVNSPGNGNGSNSLKNQIEQLLIRNFPLAREISVRDISGGCGSMFEVFVASSDFQGMPKVKQHLKVSTVLKEEIRDMHGIRIFTEIPPPSK